MYWVMWLIFSCVNISISSLLQVKYTRGVEALSRAKRFESEIFALGLSYTMNLIIIAGLCDVKFVALLDGQSEVPSDRDEEKHWYCFSLSILYPMLITTLLTALHSMGLFEKASEALEDVDKSQLEAEQEDAAYEEIQRLTIADNNLRHSITTAGGFRVKGGEPAFAMNPAPINEMDRSSNTSTSSDSSKPSSPSTGNGASLDERYSKMGSVIKQSMSPVDAVLCSWDRRRTVNLAISMMVVTMSGFYCGSSWYAWSILSFQFLLQGAYILSSFVFAGVITYMAWSYMVMVTFRFEQDEMKRNTHRLTTSRRKRNQLITLAGR